MQIQLPISTEQLLDQVRVTREFVERFDVRREQRQLANTAMNLHRHLGGVDSLVFAIVDRFQFTEQFDRTAELSRLSALELALKSGMKSLQFN